MVTCCLMCSNSSRRQRPGLAQHGVVDADLADVVQQAGQVDVAQLVLLQAQLAAQLDGDAGDALAVAEGVRVLGVQRRRQRARQADQQLLEVLVAAGAAARAAPAGATNGVSRAASLRRKASVADGLRTRLAAAALLVQRDDPADAAPGPSPEGQQVRRLGKLPPQLARPGRRCTGTAPAPCTSGSWASRRPAGGSRREPGTASPWISDRRVRPGAAPRPASGRRASSKAASRMRRWFLPAPCGCAAGASDGRASGAPPRRPWPGCSAPPRCGAGRSTGRSAAGGRRPPGATSAGGSCSRGRVLPGAVPGADFADAPPGRLSPWYSTQRPADSRRPPGGVTPARRRRPAAGHRSARRAGAVGVAGLLRPAPDRRPGRARRRTRTARRTPRPGRPPGALAWSASEKCRPRGLRLPLLVQHSGLLVGSSVSRAGGRVCGRSAGAAACRTAAAIAWNSGWSRSAARSGSVAARSCP